MNGDPTLTRLSRAVVVALAALVTAVSLGGDLPRWLGSWSETGAAWEVFTRFSYPIVAAVSAWFATARRRHAYEAWVATSSRSRTQLCARLVVECAALGATGFVAVVMVSAAATGTQATYGSIDVPAAIVVMCGFLPAAALGVLLGARLPAYVAPAVALLLVFAWNYLTLGLTQSTEALQALAVASDVERTFASEALLVVSVRAAFLVALAAALIGLAGRGPGVWLWGLGGASLCAALLLLTGGDTFEELPGARDERCDASGGLRICLTAARWHEAQDVRSAAAPFVSALDGIADGEVVLVEETIGGGRGARFDGADLVVPVGLVNGNEGNGHQVAPDELVALVATTIFAQGCVVSPDEASGTSLPMATPADVVEAAALRSAGIPVDGSVGFASPDLRDTALDWRPVADFRGWWEQAGAAERKEWLAAHRVEVVTCRTASPQAP